MVTCSYILSCTFPCSDTSHLVGWGPETQKLEQNYYVYFLTSVDIILPRLLLCLLVNDEVRLGSDVEANGDGNVVGADGDCIPEEDARDMFLRVE